MIIKVLVIFLFLAPTLVSASEVVLKSGQKLEGKITEQTDKYIKMDPGIGMVMTYYTDEIDTMDGQKMQVPSSPVQERNNIPIDGSMNTISVGDKTVHIVDSFASLEGPSDWPYLSIYFFSRPLTKEQKENKAFNPIAFEELDHNFPVLWMNFSFKKGAQNCSDDNLNDYVAIFEKSNNFQFDANLEGPLNFPLRRSDKDPLSTIGIKNISCSFEQGAKININIKKNQIVENQGTQHNSLLLPGQSSIVFAWDINMTSEMNLNRDSDQTPPLKQQNEPIVETISAEELGLPKALDLFELQGSLLVFYTSHNRQPNNDDIEELKTIAMRTSKLDLNKYDLDFQGQPDGRVKLKYKLKSDSIWTEISLQKPVPQ